MERSREDHLFVDSCIFMKVFLEKQVLWKMNKFGCIRTVSAVQSNEVSRAVAPGCILTF